MAAEAHVLVDSLLRRAVCVCTRTYDTLCQTVLYIHIIERERQDMDIGWSLCRPIIRGEILTVWCLNHQLLQFLMVEFSSRQAYTYLGHYFESLFGVAYSMISIAYSIDFLLVLSHTFPMFSLQYTNKFPCFNLYCSPCSTVTCHLFNTVHCLNLMNNGTCHHFFLLP